MEWKLEPIEESQLNYIVLVQNNMDSRSFWFGSSHIFFFLREKISFPFSWQDGNFLLFPIALYKFYHILRIL